MSSAVKRKPGPPSGRGQDDSSYSTSFSSSSSSSSSSAPDHSRERKYKEPVFRHGDLLLMCLSPSVLVMLAFGGRPSLVAICFGSLFSYIFDILGAMEATILCVVVSLMGVWGTLLYSARHLLEESLMNLPMLGVLTLVLVLVFLTVTGMFRGLLMEFDGVFYFLETFLFAVIPLLSASVVSWFVSVEFPMMDLAFSFSTCYYLFLLILAYPRLSSHPTPSRPNKISNKFVLSFPVLYSMYLLPVVMSPILFVALHHNVSMTSVHRLMGFIVSIFYPILLVILAAERHTEYYPEESRKGVRNFLFIGKVFSALGIVILFQSHDIIEEIKFFSGLGEPFASLTIIFSAALLLLAALLVNLKKTIDMSSVHDTDVMGRPVSTAYSQSGLIRPGVLTFLIEACYIGAIVIVYVILGILSPALDFQQNLTIVITVFVGCWALAEYFEQQKLPPSAVDITVQLKNALCIILSGSCAAFGMHMFTVRHLQFLDFTLEWSLGNVHLQSLCTFSAILTGGAVMIPTMLHTPGSSSRSTNLGFVPGSQGGEFGAGVGGDGSGVNSSPGGIIDVRTAETYGSLMFVFFSLGVSGFELLIREQDWAEVAGGATSADVYPAYFLAGTAVVFIMTSLHLCAIDSVGIATLWIVGLTQCCKMLHLMDFSSEMCFCILSLFVSLTQPFVLYLRDGWKEINNSAADVVNGVASSTVWAPRYMYIHVDIHLSVSWFAVLITVIVVTLVFVRIGFFEGLWYIIMCGLSCDLAARSFLPLVLVELTGREVTATQCHALGWALWCFFCAGMSFCFLREAAVVRSVLCLAGGVCFMVAGNALGTLNITYDPSSPFLFTFQLLEEISEGEEGEVDHGGLYAALSAVLCVASFLGLMPLKTALQRISYLLCFSYCASMAFYYWVFPDVADHASIITLNSDSILSYPWLICFLSVFFSTSTVLNISSAGTGSGWMLTISSAIPITFTAVAALSSDLEHFLPNTFLLTMMIQIASAVCSRLIDFSREHDPQNLSSRAQRPNSTQSASSSFAETVCMFSSILAFSFGLMHCLFSHHVICDFAVPALSIVFATSKEFGWAMSGNISAMYWTMSAVYSLFVKDYNGLEFLHEFATPFHGRKGVLADSDLSIWSKELAEGGYAWLSWIHVVLVILALGPIIMSQLRGSRQSVEGRGRAPRRGQHDGTDDILFVLTILSVIPLITAQLWSVRLLGLLGILFGVCNAFYFGETQRRSDSTI